MASSPLIPSAQQPLWKLPWGRRRTQNSRIGASAWTAWPERDLPSLQNWPARPESISKAWILWKILIQSRNLQKAKSWTVPASAWTSATAPVASVCCWAQPLLLMQLPFLQHGPSWVLLALWLWPWWETAFNCWGSRAFRNNFPICFLLFLGQQTTDHV